MDAAGPGAIGGELSARRRARGSSRADLARAVGTRSVIVGRWERGEALPAPDQVSLLAEVLDLDPPTLAGWQAAVQDGAVRSRGPAPGGPFPPAVPLSYLDDPAERRRYLLRGALTLAALGVLAVLLIWALAGLADGWGALLDLLRGGSGAGDPAGLPVGLAGA